VSLDTLPTGVNETVGLQHQQSDVFELDGQKTFFTYEESFLLQRNVLYTCYRLMLFFLGWNRSDAELVREQASKLRSAAADCQSQVFKRHTFVHGR